jgi:hypothetical protein
MTTAAAIDRVVHLKLVFVRQPSLLPLRAASVRELIEVSFRRFASKLFGFVNDVISEKGGF